MVKKVIAALVCGLVALVLAAGCDGFGLGGGGAGGAGGSDPLGGTPCQNTCHAKWDVAMNACVNVSEAGRKACQDQADAALTQCMTACSLTDCLEECKQECDRNWEDCRDSCPKGDKNCLYECTNTLGKCLKACDKKCK